MDQYQRGFYDGWVAAMMQRVKRLAYKQRKALWENNLTRKNKEKNSP